jgi:hypothetical protein
MGTGRSSQAIPSARDIVIYRPTDIQPVRFAAGQISDALKQISFSVSEKSLIETTAEQRGQRIILTVKGLIDKYPTDEIETSTDGLAQQGYVIIDSMPDFWVIGADDAGAMYGGLHLAEMIRIERSLQKVQPCTGKPSIVRRGIKFNIPLDARTPSYDDTGDAAQNNYAEMWSFDFWREFLDDMARHRYNTLTLWNPHPFPSIVKLPDCPDVALDDVCVTTLKPTYEAGAWRDPQFVAPQVLQNLKVIKKMTIDEKIEFWRRVMQHAKDRCIDIYWITWNVITNGAEGKYGITNDQDNENTIAYIRQCVCQTILTYPLLTGIGVTAGENMKQRNDEFSKEKWLWKTYGLGILDAKKLQPSRTVRFIHRVWQTDVSDIVEDFGSKYPDPFELSFKYAKAHMYSSTKPPFCKPLLGQLDKHDLKCWWNLRNDDIFNFRWGDPEFVREFLHNLPEQTAGYYMGSDGYVWGREFTSRQPDNPRQLEIRKHWYSFMLWGRLGYDLEMKPEYIHKILYAQFPQAKEKGLYETWATASKIIPLVNRFHWCDWDFQWAVEGCFDQRNGFHTVRDFIKTTPMEGTDIASIPQYVEKRLANEPITGTTPMQIAEQLRQYADRSLAGARGPFMYQDEPLSKEIRATLTDIKAMAHLGNYYASKILGAIELHQFERSKDPQHKSRAVTHLSEAVGHWDKYAKVAAGQYRPQLLARTRMLDWVALLEDVKKDVDIARQAGSE